MSILRKLTAVTLALATAVVGLTAAVPAQAEPDIVDRLRAVPGLTIVSEEAAPAGFRFFFLTYRQPADHLNPQGITFEQRFSLLHKGTDRPMVLHTTGYDMPEFAFRSEPTRLIDGNQISTEQRFFTPSRPDPADWTKLTIWQAATDHHRLIQALKPIYNQKWISTGASKGGMTSVYHRRFYPRDIDGVAAYVAPNDVVNRSDEAYERFFDVVGNDPACRTALNNFQREAFSRRTDLVNMYEAYAAANGLTFNQVFGSADAAFEFAVLDSRWAFWQFLGQPFCPDVPPTTASTQEIFDFVDATAGWAFYADQGILFYAPYFYQAATQLGWPQLRFRHVRDLLHYPGLYNEANSSLPRDLRSRHDAWPMIDVDNWVTKSSSQMLFVYGANDPWGAEPFHPSGNDSYTYTAPGSNHGANISRLTAADNAAATATLRRWAGVSVSTFAAQSFIPELDVRNPDTQRRPL
ncbi:MAG TPA: S28 family serine protease [Actinophytocola sp.]|uniref:S28 family serine protease n=1 Tax=Actinophytocola sp. TaxID=1872138 RepID=UPI002DDC8FEE|nr:S28 family serine protease [Actinophytocola sp.]HEV2781193.1 S28 family serine protease [Actinophytocola sp.]